MTMRRDAVALLSGGLDSAVALAAARGQGEGEIVLALTADYGQVAASREIAAARAIASALGVPHRVVALPFLAEAMMGGRPHPLVDASVAPPEPSAAEIERGGEAARRSAEAVWVPNRNGLLVNVAAAFAEATGASRVVTGFNREEAETFPDNSLAFVEAANRALALSTRTGVRVESPTAALDKKDIVALGRKLGAPIERIWSCYRSGPRMCGRCESCRRLKRALSAASCLEWFTETGGHEGFSQ